MAHPIFRDRTEAGQMLADRLLAELHDVNPLVLALPRGGVPVAAPVARALHAELDVFAVRKIGLPGQEELALGALAPGGVCVMNQELVNQCHLANELLDRLLAKEQRELERRDRLYRGDRSTPEIGGRDLILVDDGLATGASMKAAAQALRLQEPRRLTVAVPVAARPTFLELHRFADSVVCVELPEPFLAVGLWYKEFRQVTDREVIRLLDAAWQTR